MLHIQGLTKIFGRGTPNENRAIENLSLRLKEGDFVTVIGGNGAGKTTLLNLIAGVYSVDAGSIMVDNVDVTRLPEHRRAKYLGRVFQDPNMGTAPKMSICENLALASRRSEARGMKPCVQKARLTDYKKSLLALGLGLENRLLEQVGMLSGGQRQAVTLIMATIKRPKLLLLDEHTAALDPTTAERVLEITERLVRENALTTMMVTHNMRDAIAYGNRLIMMDRGRIVLDIEGEEKKRLTVKSLMDQFAKSGGGFLANDRILLSKAQ